MKLDPITLRLFVAVMEESTIAAAAAREHIAASAVSRRLADLEDALHVALFTRSNKGTEPTAVVELYGPNQRSGGALRQFWRKMRLRTDESAPLHASMRRAGQTVR